MTIKAFSELQGLSFEAVQNFMLHEAQEHDLPVLSKSETSLQIESEFGVFGITDLPDGKVRMDVESKTEDQLHALRDSLVHHLVHYLPDVAKSISWSDTIHEGALPPNFQFATVVSVAQASRAFTRVKLKLRNADLFDDSSIHFRFLFPKNETISPQWPTVAANGSTKWPQGEYELHRPVYTVREIRGDIAFVDIFHHVGGFTWEWSKSAKMGDKVAILGPGGNGVLQANDVILAADETAYPATVRILNALPDDATARVILVTHTSDNDYPLPKRAGVTLEWVEPESFGPRIVETVQENTPAFLWVGAEAQQVKALRTDPIISTLDKSQKRLAVYWVDEH